MALGQMANCTTWQHFQVHSYLSLLPVPCPEKSFLSLFCSSWHLKTCILYFWCRPCTKEAIKSQFSIQGNLSSDKFFPKSEINQPAGAQDAASASSSEASAAQVATDTVPQIFMSISHLCDPTVLSRSYVISAHFTQQAQKINISVLSFKYSHWLWVPKNTPKLKTDTNLQVMLENKGPDNFFWTRLKKTKTLKYPFTSEGLCPQYTPKPQRCSVILFTNCFQGLMWVFLAVSLSWIDTYFVNLSSAKLHTLPPHRPVRNIKITHCIFLRSSWSQHLEFA